MVAYERWSQREVRLYVTLISITVGGVEIFGFADLANFWFVFFLVCSL